MLEDLPVRPHLVRVAVSSNWTYTAVGIIACWITLLGMFRSAVSSFFEAWHSSTYSHAPLVLPITLYLVWSRRRQLIRAKLRTSVFGLLMLAVACLAAVAGGLGQVQVIQQLALIAMLEATVWAIAGTNVVRILLFPFFFLFFTAPFGDSVIGPLQDFTATVAVFLLRISHIPVVLEGRLIFIPTATWEVAEACSGARYLISATFLGLLFAFVVYKSWRRRVAFVALSALVAIFANAVRAYGIIVLGYISNNRLAHGVDHYIYGWAFFTVIMLLLYLIGTRWQEREQPVKASEYFDAKASSSRTESSRGAIALSSVTAMLIVILLPVAARTTTSLKSNLTFSGNLTPAVESPWAVSSDYPVGWISPTLHPAEHFLQSYSSGDHQVFLYMGYYSIPQKGLEFVGWESRLLNYREWQMIGEHSRTALVDGQAVTVREMTTQGKLGRRLVWVCYWADNRFAANAYEVKLLQAKAQLTQGPLTAVAIAIGADFEGDPAPAERALQDFVSHVSFAAALPKSSRR